MKTEEVAPAIAYPLSGSLILVHSITVRNGYYELAISMEQQFKQRFLSKFLWNKKLLLNFSTCTFFGCAVSCSALQ